MSAAAGERPTIEQLRQALQAIHHYAIGESRTPYMSIPADPRRDADIMLADALEELAALRARLEPSAMYDLVQHLHRQRAFSARTFGPGERPAATIAHIRKELLELEAAPADLEEWIDVALLAFDGAWRTGATPELVAEALRAKLEKNEARTWPDWRKVSPAEPVEHLRGEGAAR